MVTTLPTQWEQTHGRIGIERINAIKAHAEVRMVLETDPTLRSWGVDTVLIGSYARKTAVFPCKDVDVFVKLPNVPKGASPEMVFSEVQRALVAHFKGRATEQRRSMKISGFNDELSVDAVPAVRDGAHWKIPQTSGKRTGERWVKDEWETTDPELFAEMTKNVQSISTEIEGQGSYLRTIRLVKQMRDYHVGRGEKPGGLYFELMTFRSFTDGAKATSYAELLVLVLDSIAAQLAHGQIVVEPAMGQAYSPRPDPAAIAKAAEVFARLVVDARRALGLDDCAAAAVWRRMLGENDKVGRVFPLPPGCTESGERIAALPNRDRGSNADRDFA